MSALYIPVFYIPIYFQFVRNDNSLEAAVRLLSFIILFIAANIGAGYLLPKVNYYIILYIVSGVLVTIAGALYYAYITPDTTPALIYGSNIIGGLGSGLTSQVGFTIATLKAHPRDAVNAITLQNLGQLGAGLIALVIAGQVFQSTAVENLSKVLASAGYTYAQIMEAAAGAQSEVFKSLDGDVRVMAIEAITDAIRKDFILVIVAGAVILLSGLVMRRKKLF